MSTSFRNRIGVSVVLIQAILLASVGGKWNPSPVPDPNAPAHFPKNQALWQQWCSGGSHRYTACFQRTDGDMHDDLTVSNDAAGHTVLSEDGKSFGVMCQSTKATLFITVGDSGTLGILGPVNVVTEYGAPATVCCQVDLAVNGQHTQSYVCPGDTLTFPGNLGN